MAEIDFKIKLPITPAWGNIELLRTSVLHCLGTIFADTGFCHSVGMITSELLENAVKYGDWTGGRRNDFQLGVSGDESQVRVEVQNPVAEGGADLRAVLDAVAFIRSFDTAEEAYRERLRQVAEHEKGRETSLLGLARIAYEGDCEVDAFLDDDGILHVTAVSRSSA